MSRFALVIFILSSSLLTACHQSGVEVGASAGVYYDYDSGYESGHDHYLPQIREFGLVDSYGNDSQYSSHGSLALDPFLDFGIFEVYWDVSSFYNYEVNLYINDRPGLNHAILIGTDSCGPLESCDSIGNQVCQYNPDFYLGCGYDLDDADYFAQSVDVLLSQIPDRAYLSLEVCPAEGGYCEVQSIPVTLY